MHHVPHPPIAAGVESRQIIHVHVQQMYSVHAPQRSTSPKQYSHEHQAAHPNWGIMMHARAARRKRSSVPTFFVSIVDDTPGKGELDSDVSGELALFLV